MSGVVPKRLIGEHAVFNALAELAWNGFAVKPNEPEFQARWRAARDLHPDGFRVAIAHNDNHLRIMRLAAKAG